MFMKEKVSKCIDYAKNRIIDLVYSSACIEGLGTTLKNIDYIISNLPVNTTRDEVLFAVNMYDAYNFVFDIIECNDYDYLPYNVSSDNCLGFIKELSKISGNRLISDSGKVRTQRTATSHTGRKSIIPCELAVNTDIDIINTLDDPEDRAVTYFCYLCRIQVFSDGNERVAQLMANKILIENGIGIFVIPEDRIAKLKGLLVSYYETYEASSLCTFLKKYCIERI